ncbi:7 transmembrane receptor (rhodopsin family) [Popillia japonica]|uniref:7 transmembrane receptor (Rhodopsin family) n=1 Tax=Popillia japonica TaxID=7064 RepID=A0AAW1J1K6_POPJA
MNNTTSLGNESPQIPILVLLCLIFVMGLLGNLSVCIVIINNNCMRTATNYYLFSLAVSDIVIIICSLLPWILNIFVGSVLAGDVCVIKEVMAKLGYFASLLTITTLSAESFGITKTP